MNVLIGFLFVDLLACLVVLCLNIRALRRMRKREVEARRLLNLVGGYFRNDNRQHRHPEWDAYNKWLEGRP